MFLGLDRIAAGGRLVEQQHLRFAGERARDLQPLERAIGERTGRTIGRVGEPDASERRQRRFAGRPVLPRHRRPMQEIGQNAGALMAMAADHDVFQHRHAEEDLQVLERARQPAPRQPVGRQAGHVSPASRTLPSCGG